MWNFPGYFHFLHRFYILSLLKNNKHVLLFQKEVCIWGNCTYCRSGKGKERLCGRTFWVQGDEGDVVSDVLTPWLSTGGNRVAGLRPALPILVVAVFLSRHLHHDGVLPTPRNRTERGNKNTSKVVRAAQPRQALSHCNVLAFPYQRLTSRGAGGHKSSHAAPSTKIDSNLMPGNSLGLKETVYNFRSLKNCLYHEVKSQLTATEGLNVAFRSQVFLQSIDICVRVTFKQ